MARVFKCDKCGKIIEDNGLMKHVSIDFYDWDDEHYYWKVLESKKKDVCPDCFDYIKAMMED